MSVTSSHTTDENSSPECEKPPCESKGERVFNYATYTGIGFLLNLGLSVAITDYFTHGKGSTLLRALSKHSANLLHDVSGASAAKLENTTYGFLKTNALQSGGHVVMVPIKLLEDSKRHIVHRINRFLGVDQPILKDGKEVPMAQLKEEELPELFEDQPKQSWWNVILRRATGLVFTTAIGTGLGEERLQKVEHTLTDKMFLPALRKLPSPAVQNLANNDTFARYARLVSLDQFFTLITSTVTYITNGAKKHEKAPAPTTIVQSIPPLPLAMSDEASKRASFVEALNRGSPNAEMAV